MAFVERFALREIGEFYGATEGNLAFFNYWSRPEPPGAIGMCGAQGGGLAVTPHE